MSTETLHLHDLSHTFELGRQLGAAARGGEFFALCGPLGAGKTALTKGIAAGLETAPDDPIVSPTFVLAREYAGRLRLFHLDAYRLGSAAELAGLGFADMIDDPSAVVVVEWADRVRESVPPHACWIELAYADGDGRRATIRPPAQAG